MKVVAIIPCYNVKKKIIKVIKKTLLYVDRVVVVDDFCPENTGTYVNKNMHSKKITVIYNKKNLGVGGATIKGYQIAMQLNADIVIKIDGDGQMNPVFIPKLIKNIISKNADYCKGNRFFTPKIIYQMPLVRLIGNFFLSFVSKLSTGYLNIFDFTNGYTAISKQALKKLNFSNIQKNFFFETDMLFYLYLNNLKVKDIDIESIYNNSTSNLKITKVFFYFVTGNFYNFLKRIYIIHLKKYFFLKIFFSSLLFLIFFYLEITVFFFLFLILLLVALDVRAIPYRSND